MDLKEVSTGVDPNLHWYYQSKQVPLLHFFDTALPPSESYTLLDIGAGNGFFTKTLRQHFPSRISQSLLIDSAYRLESQENPKEPNSAISVTLPDKIGHSVVLLMDVLEHIADDKQFLADLKQRSTPSGSNYFFISVPAFNCLWSRHDLFLDHHRRYTRTSLRSVLDENGYQANRIYYIYNGLLPVVYLKRRISDWLFAGKPVESELKPLPGFLNAILLRYTRFEWRFMRYFKWFGLTCVAEGRF